jgi:hypothetical protein
VHGFAGGGAAEDLAELGGRDENMSAVAGFFLGVACMLSLVAIVVMFASSMVSSCLTGKEKGEPEYYPVEGTIFQPEKRPVGPPESRQGGKDCG